MAYITLNTHKLKHNFHHLNSIFDKANLQWAVVAKLLCGNKLYLEKVLELNPKQICDSRASNLKMIKKINPEITTIYIKPVAKQNIATIVTYADISFNSEIETIELLSLEAVKQNKNHKVVIMVELGELREGVKAVNLIDFYAQIYQLPNIDIVGLGTNLTCMYGVLPTPDKLIQLSLYREIIELKFNTTLPLLSGGASVTVPLVLNNTLPEAINHFRIGEALFFGTNPYDNLPLEHMYYDIFTLQAQIIELHDKPLIPNGTLGANLTGETIEFDQNLIGDTTIRAIVDIGLLDVQPEHITPIDSSLEILGASSDMIVVDLKNNTKCLKVGDFIDFQMDYMGVLAIMNSKYIDKEIFNGNAILAT